MSEHNRREVYWQYYEPAKEVEASRLRSALIEIIQESHYPRQEKLDFACLLMMADSVVMTAAM